MRVCPECQWENPGAFDECGRCHHEFTPAKKMQKSEPKSPKKVQEIPDNSRVEIPAINETSSAVPTEKSHNLRKAILIGTVISGIYFFNPISDFLTVLADSSGSSVSIQDIANHSGLNIKGKAIFYRTSPELVNANTINEKCPNADETVIEYGCYLPHENKMYILEVADSNYNDIEYTVAAHETLHAIWMKLAAVERQNVTKLIKQFYDDTSNTSAIQMHSTLIPYGNEQAIIDNELHSFIGSEVSYTNISQALETYYDKYFVQRSEPVASNVTFNSKIDAKIVSINAEFAALEKSSADIDTYKSKWLDSIQYYMNQSRYYGDTYTYNKNVDAYNNNLINYNNQIKQYNIKRDAYNAEVSSFNTMLKAFYPTRTQLNTKG